MANPERTLSLKILGDTKNLVDALNKGSKGTESFGKQVSDISAKVVKSFVAITTAVGAFSVMFAKAAAEDQAAANKLAQTLGAVTDATEKQIRSVNSYITQVSLATGVTDDELRPSFERLARSTKDVDQAQTLLNLSLDLAAATSKPLESVTSALGKAYDGNYTALNRLGLGIDQSLIKSKDFNAIYKELNSTFGEFSEKRSEEALVKFQRLQIAIQEAKEQVGAALLPVFERLGDWLLNEGVPRLNAFIAGLTGDQSLSSSFNDAQQEAEKFGAKTRSVIKTIVDYKDELIAVGAVAAGIFVATKIAAGVQATIMLVKGLIGVYNALRVSAMAAGIASMFALNPVLGALSGAAAFGLMGMAIRQFQSQDISVDGVPGTGAIGNFQMSTGTVLGESSRSLGGGTPTPSGGFTPAGGGSGVNLAQLSGGLVTSPQDLINRLQSTSSKISDIQFALDTGQISKAKAAELLRPIQKEFNMLERVGQSLQAASVPSAPINQTSAEDLRFARVININVNAPSVIDETGFSRAVQNAIQNSEFRGTYTGGL